ncbi:hypothetical protein Tco_0933269 [Tanacetum coccineum]
MGRDTIQIEDAVSTISEEYLLEFTSEYGIPESLHPEFPGPEEPIVEFPEGKVGVYHMEGAAIACSLRCNQLACLEHNPHTEFIPCFLHMDLFKLISAPNPAKVKTGTRPRAAHEVPLLTVTTSRVIDMEDTAVASGGTKDQVEDGLSHEIPPVETATTTEVVQEPGLEKEVAAIGPPVNKRRHKRGNDEGEANAPPKVLRK